MKKIKKIFAVLLSMAMVLGMSITSFAAEGKTPVEGDTEIATVSNVEEGATVTAYQIVKAKYNTAGFTGYEAATGVTLANPLMPTSDEVTAIAKNVEGLKSVAMTGNEGTYTGALNAGYWIVLVNGTVESVYNPMLVGIAYSKSGSDNTLTADPVDATTNWDLATEGAYAKSTTPTIDKAIVNGDKDIAIGDTVDFKITTAIPSYSKEYTEVVVKISDSLSKGLTLDTNSLEVSIPEDSYGVSTDTQGFVLTINSDYALTNGNKEVQVTYSATLNEDAGVNFDANTNTATLEYSNNPKDSNDTKTTEDKTYSYTFGIDSKLYGESTDSWNKITQEILKGEMVKETVEGQEKEVFKVLQGAEFTLTNNNTDKAYVATSDAEGQLAFIGLDAGEYTLIETKAPKGYSVSTKETPVVISAQYNEDGTLKSYSITIDGTATSTYEATYTGEGTETTVTEVIEKDNATTEILNTKLSELPSTGGIGTTIFTIGGCLIMIIAAALFFASRKKSNK